MKNKIVSIIVPCYNCAPYISETLDSVLSSSYSLWECIVIDDGSTDASSQIASEYVTKDSRFKLIQQRNLGVSIARNNGIEAAKGEYILPLDADDLIASTYIEKAVNVLESDDSVKLVYCKADFFGEKKGHFNLDYSYEKLLWYNEIFNCAMYRKSDFIKTGGYAKNMQKGYEDWDFWLSFLTKNDKVVRLDETLFFYRIKKESRNKGAMQFEKELRKQIVINHKNIYEPYLTNIINWHNAASAYDGLKKSKMYRFAKKISILLTPLRKILRG